MKCVTIITKIIPYLIDFCLYILKDDLIVAVVSVHQSWNALQDVQEGKSV